MSLHSDNPMADVYGANLYNDYLQNSLQRGAQMQAKGCKGGVDASEDCSPTASDAYGAKEDLPEGCSSILVCTGVYSRDQQDLAPEPTGPVSEQQVFHGHRDFCFNSGFMQPSFVVHDVKEAVELVFQQEGWPLE